MPAAEGMNQIVGGTLKVELQRLLHPVIIDNRPIALFGIFPSGLSARKSGRYKKEQERGKRTMERHCYISG